MTSCYVVFASTGEYSDRTEWPLVVVMSEDRAKAIVGSLDACAMAHGVRDSNGGYDSDRTSEALAAMALIAPGLTDVHIDYTGISFYYAEVAIEGDAP